MHSCIDYTAKVYRAKVIVPANLLLHIGNKMHRNTKETASQMDTLFENRKHMNNMRFSGIEL